MSKEVYLVSIVNYDVRSRYELENIDIKLFYTEKEVIEYLKGIIEKEKKVENPTIELLRKLLLSHFGKLITIKNININK
jgi:hypothetical protein